MKTSICPKCKRVMSYDPYFKANICRQCGFMESITRIEVSSKRFIEIKGDFDKKKMLLYR